MPSPVFALTDTAPEASIPIISSISLTTPFRIRRRQVDLVEDREYFESHIDRSDTVCDTLRFHALCRINHEQRTFTCGQRA